MVTVSNAKYQTTDKFVADIWLLKKIPIFLNPKIPNKNLHEWGLGEADRAEIKLGKSYGLGEYFQP